MAAYFIYIYIISDVHAFVVTYKCIKALEYVIINLLLYSICLGSLTYFHCKLGSGIKYICISVCSASDAP